LEASLLSIEQAKIRALIENNLLEIYYAEGDLQLASKTTEDLLKTDPHNPDVLFMVYRIHMEIANRARDALTAIAPDSARNHQIMAEHFINLGDAPNAIIQYQSALEIDPNLPGLTYELAEATIQDSLSATSLAKAKDLLAKSLVEDPRNSGAEARLGGIAMIENNPEMAKQYFSRALAIQPDQLDAMKGMADIAANQGDKEEAIRYLVRASQEDPMDEKLHYRLSRLYRELDRVGESDKELELFKKVRDLKKKTESVEQRKSSL
jgi:tetratricopeptide (TPR) repeat protein